MNILKILLIAFYCNYLNADVLRHFDTIKKDPSALYAFFKQMPKGGELHYHLAGGSYAETMLSIASKADYCLNTHTFALSKIAPVCEGLKTKELSNHPQMYEKVVKDWSFKDFYPGAQSGHDHFFNAFLKFLPLVMDHRPELLVDIVQRAANQQEEYLEIMMLSDNAKSAQFADLIKDATTFAQKKQILLANKEFQDNIHFTIEETNRILATARQLLECDKHPQSAACLIKIKFLYYVLREQSEYRVFAQALNGFAAVAQSKNNLVGINLVQPEDGIISLRDYKKQMQIFKFLHQVYPEVHIALHAGELTPANATPEDLTYHIYEALFTGNAQRIGHGVSIAYEDNVDAILKYMAEKHVPVEINLISNLKILNLKGRKHPLNYYLAHKVPVVLSTDDEGILRTNLTLQFVEAVLKHGLSYPTLKQINRNTLTYAFIPGKSIWANAYTASLVDQCHDLLSTSCKTFIKNNEKAQLQWDLEQKLNTFERSF